MDAYKQGIKGHFITKRDITEIGQEMKKPLYKVGLIKYLSDRTLAEFNIIFQIKKIIFKIFKAEFQKEPAEEIGFFYAVATYRKFRRSYLTAEQQIQIEKEHTSLKIAGKKKRSTFQKITSIKDEIFFYKQNHTWQDTRKYILKKHHSLFLGVKIDEDYFRKLSNKSKNLTL